VRALAAALLAACVLAAGCGRTIDVGQDPDFYWWTDHETGALDDWTRGGPGEGWTYAAGGGAVTVGTGVARSGRYALVSTGGAAGTTSAGQATRRGPGAAAYYGAWLYLPAPALPATYWVFFSFHTRTPAGNDTALWDLKLADAGAGTLGLQLLHHDTGNLTPISMPAAPLGRWFQVQAFFAPALDDTGALRVWLDGTLAFDFAGPTINAGASGADVTWTLGTITDGLTPAPATLYADDAFIAKRQVDFRAPPFWRP
jgi:hypothetical protein